MTDVPMDVLLSEAETRLAAAGIEGARREARLLLAHVLGISVATLLTVARAMPVPRDRFDLLLARRTAREPLAYLTGVQGFWTLDLQVSDATLIPRADSETVIEALLQARPDRARPRRVLDLGTGTGCLLLAALSEYPAAWGLGIDLSPAACRLAAANADGNGLAARCTFLCDDWAASLEGRFDVILGNPPYIPAADLGLLMPEVVGYEPSRALDGGIDGLTAYRSLMPVLERLLEPDGVAILEVGIGQAGDVLTLAVKAGLRRAGIRMDLGGVERAVLIEHG